MSVSAGRRVVSLMVVLFLCGSLWAQAPDKSPSAEEVADLLQREPITLENWMAWRDRLVKWANDKGTVTAPAFDAAAKFIRAQTDAKGGLPETLGKDNVAWLLLGRAYHMDVARDADPKASLQNAEKAVRQSIKVDPKFASAKRDLALYLVQQEELQPTTAKTEPGANPEPSPRFAEALTELAAAAVLDPKLPLATVRARAGRLAYKQELFAQADEQLSAALREDPALAATLLNETALSILRNAHRDYSSTSTALKDLTNQHPKDATLAAIHGLALVALQDLKEATTEFNRARSLGAEPSKAVPGPVVVRTARDILRNRHPEYAHAAMAIQVLADQFPKEGGIAAIHGLALFGSNNVKEAMVEFDRAGKLGTDPSKVVSSKQLADASITLMRNPLVDWPTAIVALRQLHEQFPQEGLVVCFLAYSLAAHGDFEDAVSQLDRARAMGTDPALIQGLPVRQIESMSRRNHLQRVFTRTLLGVGCFYVIALGLMVGIGQRRSKRPPSADTTRPTAPALTPPRRPYAELLVAGLVGFRLTVVLLGVLLLLTSAGLLFLMFGSPEIPISVMCALILVGVLTWNYLVTLFTRTSRERRGMSANPVDTARLREVVLEVSQRMDADPVDEVRLTNGADVRVQPKPRGPFGILGSQRQVLTLGLAALRYLTVGELRALVAQQCVQYSRGDSSAGRFVTRGQRPVAEAMNDRVEEVRKALKGLPRFGQAGLLVVKVAINPCAVLLYLYYRAYAMLATDFLRSRLLEADQAAAQLYGSDALSSALTKANVEAPLFVNKVQRLVKELLPDEPDLGNMYAAWEDLCNDALTAKEREGIQASATAKEKGYTHLAITTKDRDKLRQKKLAEAATDRQHPSLQERLEALKSLPAAQTVDTASALQLLDNLETIEEQLTEFVTQALTAEKEQAPATTAAPARE